MDRIICLDGPSASGKGSVADAVTRKLGWHLLSSGMIYRALAFQAQQERLSFTDKASLAKLAQKMSERKYEMGGVHLEDEKIGESASMLSAYAEVREALIDLQRAYYRPPGLVAEGRDMGTVIFPSAGLKIYLCASLEIRAERRMKQLSAQKSCHYAKMQTILHQLRERDDRDANRAIAPLKKMKDAVIIDSTTLTLTEVASRVMELATKKFNLIKEN